MIFENLFLVQSTEGGLPLISMFRRVDGAVELFPVEGEDAITYKPDEYWKMWKQIVRFREEISLADFAFIVAEPVTEQGSCPFPGFKQVPETNWTRDDACAVLRRARGAGEFVLRENGVVVNMSPGVTTEKFDLFRFNVPKTVEVPRQDGDESSFCELMRHGDLPQSMKDYVRKVK